jgi:hypothetical protein
VFDDDDVPSRAGRDAGQRERGRPALGNFSLEQDRWPDWVSIDTPNPLVVNELTNLARRTGTPPWIRIGADTEDQTLCNSDVNLRICACRV